MAERGFKCRHAHPPDQSPRNSALAHIAQPAHRAAAAMQPTIRAFSLVELILALAVAGGALAVLLALLSGLLREAAGTADHQTALHLAGAIEQRLYETMGGAFPGGVQAGRVLLADNEGGTLRDESENDPTLPLAYFHIELSPFAGAPLAYEAERGVLPLRVRVSWPYTAVVSAAAHAGAAANTQSLDFVITLTPP